jgi:hypothetical protein
MAGEESSQSAMGASSRPFMRATRSIAQSSSEAGRCFSTKPSAPSCPARARVAVAGEHEDACDRRHPGDEREPVLARKIDVEDHHVGSQRDEGLERLGAAGDGADAAQGHWGAGQQQGQAVADGRVVVDHQDAQRRLGPVDLGVRDFGR